MLGDGADSERECLDELAHEGEALLYHISCSCFYEENHNQPVYIYIDYNNRSRPLF